MLLDSIHNLSNAIDQLYIALLLLPDTEYELWFEPTEAGQTEYGILPMLLGVYSSRDEAYRARWGNWIDDSNSEHYRYVVKEVPCVNPL